MVPSWPQSWRRLLLACCSSLGEVSPKNRGTTIHTIRRDELYPLSCNFLYSKTYAYRCPPRSRPFFSCSSHSLRLLYVLKLQKYLNVTGVVYPSIFISPLDAPLLCFIIRNVILSFLVICIIRTYAIHVGVQSIEGTYRHRACCSRD